MGVRRVNMGFSCVGGEEREEILLRSSCCFLSARLKFIFVAVQVNHQSPNCTRGRHIQMLMMQRNRNYSHFLHYLEGWQAD